MLPEALLCTGHIHNAVPLSVPKAQYWSPPSPPPFSHPENGKRCQALPFSPSGFRMTLPLHRMRGPAQADWTSDLTISVPCLKLSVAPHQLLDKIQIPRWCLVALGDRPLHLPGSCASIRLLPAHLPGVLCIHLACPRLQATGAPFVLRARVSALPSAVPSPDRPLPSHSQAGSCLPPSSSHICSVHSVLLPGQSEPLWAHTSWSLWDFLIR